MRCWQPDMTSMIEIMGRRLKNLMTNFFFAVHSKFSELCSTPNSEYQSIHREYIHFALLV